MKVHISLNEAPLAGFVNVNVANTPIDLGDLSPFCEASECIELFLNDVIRFMPYEKMPEVLHHASTRLRHKGKMTLIFTDMNSVIREYNRGGVDEKMFNKLIFNSSRCAVTQDYIIRIIKAIKLEILSIDVSKEQVVIVAERP